MDDFSARMQSTPAILMTELRTVDPGDPDRAVIAHAADILRRGGLVAFPTETVYGLGADAGNADAVARVFAAKGRPGDDPIIVHVRTAADLARVAASVPAVATALADAFWPGPLTLVVPRGPSIPDIVTAGLDSVAVRAPSHPVARALLTEFARPIAAPSANPFGRPSPTTAAHVMTDLGGRIDMILDGGPTDVGVESTVVDCRVNPPVVLRPGGVTLEALAAWSVRLASPAPSPGPQRSPGALPRHYAPRARLVLIRGGDADVGTVLADTSVRLARSGCSVGVLMADEDAQAWRGPVAGVTREVLGSLGSPGPVAHRLFGAIRALDARGVDVILARDFGDAGLGLAVRDRLTRAAEGRVVTVLAGAVESAVAEVLGRVWE